LANEEFHREEQNWYKQNFRDMRQETRLRKEINSIGSNQGKNRIKGFRLIPVT